MKAKEFISVLRTLIREEVRAAVRQELNEMLTEGKKTATTQIKSTAVSKKPLQPTKKYTGNPVLDQVLNETRLTSDFRQSADVGYDDFGSFTSNNIPSQTMPTSIMDMEINDDYESPLPEMSPSLPFMKDYTQLMKKADQISQQKQF